jgi:hypothetical protein
MKGELSRALPGEGVAPVYFADFSHLSNDRVNPEIIDWVAQLRRRHAVDLRRWNDEGAKSLELESIRQELDELSEQIRERLARQRRALDARGNVERSNTRFVGRVEEFRRLHESVALGGAGVVTVIHGLGGLGKTALATEYAHAYAHEYSGGRWQIHCEGCDDLRIAFASLAPALNIEFLDEARLDPGAQLARVLNAFRGFDKRCLILLDNVDHSTLLDPAQLARLPREDWLRIVATTRLNPQTLGGNEDDLHFVSLDELSFHDAFDLIERHQPDRQIKGETERAATTEILQLLDGFTLAVETTAVWLEAPRAYHFRSAKMRYFYLYLTD